jgi:hypothetical protein
VGNPPPILTKKKSEYMKVEIENREIELKYTFRAYMIFEQITEHSFTGSNLSDFITFFYSVLMASDRELAIDFDNFIEWLDDNPDKLNEFTEWMIANTKKQSELSNSKKEVKDEKKESGSKKK